MVTGNNEIFLRPMDQYLNYFDDFQENVAMKYVLDLNLQQSFNRAVSNFSDFSDVQDEKQGKSMLKRLSSMFMRQKRKTKKILIVDD